MDFKAIDLEHQQQINLYLKQEYIESSELSFNTMFIWRKPYNMRFAITDGCLVFQSKDNGNPGALRFPIGMGDKRAACLHAMEHQRSVGEHPRFYGLILTQKEELERLFPNQFDISLMEGSADYVYSTEKLISLSGKKLHSKKNHLNAFCNTYDYTYSPISAGDASLVLKEYDSWMNQKEMDRYLCAERESVEFILNHWDAFDIQGGKLVIGGSVVAFALGERLNPDTAHIHVEKADSSVRGAYAAINQMFVQHAFSDTKFVNREEDLGIEGLRKAKQSYQPIKMVEKYKAVYHG